MQRVKLIGNISKYGKKPFKTDCANIRDIFKLIECQNPGFRQYLVKAADAGVAFEIKRGNTYLEHGDELLMNLNDEDIVITEVPAGSSSGIGKILASVVLYVISYFFPPLAPYLTPIANGLLAGGIAQILAPGPEVDNNQENDGWIFNGPVNNIGQGFPVPVAYGELRVGGTAIAVSYEPYSANSFTAIPLNAGEGTTTHNPSTNPDTDPPLPGEGPSGPGQEPTPTPGGGDDPFETIPADEK